MIKSECYLEVVGVGKRVAGSVVRPNSSAGTALAPAAADTQSDSPDSHSQTHTCDKQHQHSLHVMLHPLLSLNLDVFPTFHKLSCRFVEHTRHYQQESCKHLTFQTKPVRFWQDQVFLADSDIVLQDPSKNLARNV